MLAMLPLRMLGILMLMFSLCDANSKCPPELNPLMLDPPEVVEKIGGSVVVNCTNIDDDHEGMYWTVGNTVSVLTFDSYTAWNGSLSDWNVTAECIMKLNDTHECSRELEITLYKDPEIVVFPLKHGAAVEGKLYELQCDTDVAPVQNLTVRWYKDNQTIRTDTFENSTTKTPVSVSSILAFNISRAENGVQFRCEAQLDFGSHGSPPAVSDTYTVLAHYAPELKIQTEDVYVNDGDDVTLNCEAEGHPTPLFHWTCEGLNISENTNNLNISRITTGTICNCTATNGLGSITKQIHVQVIRTMAAAPAPMTTPAASTPKACPLVLTPAEVMVRFGDPVSVKCSTSAANVSTMGWEATVGANVSSGPDVIWRVEKLKDWTLKPLCYINLNNSFQCQAMSDVTLYKTPNSVSVYPVIPGSMWEGKEYRLKCDIKDVAPVEKLNVKWYRGNETVYTQRFNDTRKVPVNVNSTLIFTPERDYNGALFRCEAELQLGPNGPELIPTVTSSPYKAVVYYKPLFKACPDRYAGVEHEFSMRKLPCQADGKPPPNVRWYYEGQLIPANKPLTRSQSGKYTAVAGNVLGSSNTSVDITIEYGPSFACGDRYEVEENGNLQCKPEGLPEPIVTWYKDNKEVSPQRWTKYDSGDYLLEATNKHGTANHTLHLNVLYKPLFKACPDRYAGVEHEFSMQSLPCQADGNPPPNIRWYYEGQLIQYKPLTRSQSGKYTAVAGNVLGSSNTSVDITIEYGPSFACGDRYEVEENGNLQCKPEGLPEPIVTWYKDNKEVSPQRWTKYDSGDYLLEATNKHGTANHTLHLNVLYAPVFKEETDNKQVNPGGNVTIDCNAEGNPLPLIRWNYTSAVNVKETTRGSQKSISVTGATSTNTGVYICVATNKVGSVTRSVTLMIEEKTSAVPLAVILWLLLILIVALIIILMIFVHNRRKKYRKYSFVPGQTEANDGSGIPMAPLSNGVQS